MNKRTVLILGLCFVLFMLWYPLMGWLGWLPPAKRPAQAPAVAPQTPEQPAVPLPPPAEGVPAVGPAPAPDSWPAAERALPPAHTAGLGGAGQTRFTVDTVNGGVTGDRKSVV